MIELLGDGVRASVVSDRIHRLSRALPQYKQDRKTLYPTASHPLDRAPHSFLLLSQNQTNPNHPSLQTARTQLLEADVYVFVLINQWKEQALPLIISLSMTEPLGRTYSSEATT